MPSEAIRTRNESFCPDSAEKYHFLFLSGHESGHSVRIGSCGVFQVIRPDFYKLLRVGGLSRQKSRQSGGILPFSSRNYTNPDIFRERLTGNKATQRAQIRAPASIGL